MTNNAVPGLPKAVPVLEGGKAERVLAFDDGVNGAWKVEAGFLQEEHAVGARDFVVCPLLYYAQSSCSEESECFQLRVFIGALDSYELALDERDGFVW